jgi:hypothetical protein
MEFDDMSGRRRDDIRSESRLSTPSGRCAVVDRAPRGWPRNERTSTSPSSQPDVRQSGDMCAGVVVDVEVEDEAAAQQAERFASVAQAMWSGASVFLRARSNEPPSLRVVASKDIMATTAIECDRLGLPADRRTGPERVGGTVAGKALSADGRATVIVRMESVTAIDGFGQLQAAGILGHEIGHIVYDTIRDAVVGRPADVFLPWEVAEILPVLAASEYRVDLLGNVLAETVLKPTDDNGQPVALARITGPAFRDGLDDALDTLAPGLEDRISSYRIRRLSIDELWRHVARVTEGALLYLAHTEASNIGEQLVVASSTHAAAELLEPIWRPLFEYLRSASPLPDNDGWSADRDRLREIGASGVTELWRRLGLTATPHGESFYLSVDAPKWRSR